MNGERSIIPRAVLGILCLLLSWNAQAARNFNLYEWAAVAPVIVVGTSLGDNGRYHEITVEQTIRGRQDWVGQRFRVNLRDANRDRDRDEHRYSLKLTRGESYLLLLEPRVVKKAGALPTYDLARGVEGHH